MRAFTASPPPRGFTCQQATRQNATRMNESEFNRQIESTLRAIEDAVDASGADIDYDQQGGVLTLEFTSGAKLIFSRQPPLSQLWLAAPSGGFHFSWQDGQWRLPTGETLTQFVSREASTLAGETLKLEC
jgi:CyaY protein